MLVIRDKEAGNIIEVVDSIKEGEKVIDEYEAQDKQDGTYTEDFYEVVEIHDLKKIREARFMSQSQLSIASGVNLRTLQDYEQGRRNINSIQGIMLYRLAKALDVPMESLLAIEEIVG